MPPDDSPQKLDRDGAVYPLRHPLAKGNTMQMTERLIDDVIILDLQGRMTAERRGERLPSKVRRMLRQGYRSLVLNLKGVSYMDSTCLGELIAAYVILNDHGGQLKLLDVPRRIQHLLDLAKLTMIETLRSDETAMGGFVTAELVDARATVP